jgi:hypothetical protein
MNRRTFFEFGTGLNPFEALSDEIEGKNSATKEQFYADLERICENIPQRDIKINLGDFNAGKFSRSLNFIFKRIYFQILINIVHVGF